MMNTIRQSAGIGLCAVFVLTTLTAESAHADRSSTLNDDGIEAYNKGDIEQSVQKFTDALVERPDAPELRFNRGTALSAAGQAEEAVTELTRSANAFDDSLATAAALYNAGNTLLTGGNIDAAIEVYRQALMHDQSSPDIRKNLELAIRQKQQQEQQQQQQQQQDNQDQSEDEQKNDNQQDSQDEQEQNQQQPQNEQNDQEQQQQQQQPQNQQSQQQEMTPEQAQQLLDAMQDEEKEALELRRQIMQEAMEPGDDW